VVVVTQRVVVVVVLAAIGLHLLTAHRLPITQSQSEQVDRALLGADHQTRTASIQYLQQSLQPAAEKAAIQKSMDLQAVQAAVVETVAIQHSLQAEQLLHRDKVMQELEAATVQTIVRI
jgi:hypothetical protein